MVDDEIQSCDYIELINAGWLPCQIEDLYLSDDVYELKKISLQGEVIQAGDVCLIKCTQNINSFEINKKQETIYLSDGNGRILETVAVGEMETDTAYVRKNVESDDWEIGRCSPGIHNDLEMNKQVDKPILSHASGFYKTDFDLTMSASEGSIIYYTLDGSTPDENSYIYEKPIRVYDKSDEPNIWRSVQNVVYEWGDFTPIGEPVDKAFLVRAIAFDYEGNKSDEVIATYFIDKEDYGNKKVISLIADPEDLFGDDSGIYVTGREYDEWYLNGHEGDSPSPNFMRENLEIKSVIELFEQEGSLFQQQVGIRIQGASAREREDKRFSVFARKEYSGSEFLDVPLFERDKKTHSLLVRESLADVVCQELMENRDIPIMRGEEIYLFLNGEYWYDNRYLREKYSTQYFEDNYGISKENLVLFKGGQVDKGVVTDQQLKDDLFEYVQGRDFSTDTEYEKICELIDVRNFIDYLVVNIYCANMDTDDNKNVVMWRSREIRDGKYSDGRMRWALYDMDSIEWNNLDYYNVTENAEINSFSQKPEHAKCAYNEGIIYSALNTNKEFRKQFVLTFMDLMNTSFSIENVVETLKDYKADTGKLMAFFEKRPDYMKKYLAMEYDLNGTIETITIHNVNDSYGSVTINSITPDMNNGSWSGEYFTDYPITLFAEPQEGYTFIRWSGDIVSDEAIIEVPVTDGGINIVAEFGKIN